MVSISLYLQSEGEITLEKVVFNHTLLAGSRISLRSSGHTGEQFSYSFSWTLALRALVGLFTKCAAQLHGAEVCPVISGSSGSYASKLDSAVAKPSTWVSEIFGADSQGNHLLKRLLRRTNPERKRPGPVEISICARSFGRDDILIYLDGKKIVDCAQLVTLGNQLLAEEPAAHLVSSRSKLDLQGGLTVYNGARADFFRQAMIEEVTSTLSMTNIFDRSQSVAICRKIAESDYFHRLSGGSKSFTCQLDADLSGSARNGCTERSHPGGPLVEFERPLKIAIPGTQVGGLAVLYFMKHVLGYNIDLLYAFSHGQQVYSYMRNGVDGECLDGAVLSLGQMGHFLGSKGNSDFKPFMIFPQITYQVIAHRSALHGKQGLKQGQYHFLKSGPTTSSCIFNELFPNSSDRRRVSQVEAEPVEIALSLSKGDPDVRAISWFPFTTINQVFGNCVMLDEVTKKVPWRLESFLVLNRRLFRDTKTLRLFDIAIRDAWLRLIESPIERDAVVDRILADPNYNMLLRRWSGLRYFTTGNTPSRLGLALS